ncbi:MULTISPECIES: PQQ-dependent sugar dehydrogenase [unclassified Aminobacter]|uniref:PQQ-dependent sugar dehydrogenase n=1 Tax=unclassified Aminobacter TaxID=2644704 RepID=UPI0004B346EE|nr:MULTISPECIES: PQQ-dependent sugar dehydrogenase [unclassified Aminobacter]TWG49166.1 glucose/arabinose dehydrogenase [Aminobacter sp. J44]TWH30836.1 glucose/arabinose dehydrogenase [Aminobacter sp. J15]
MVRSILKASVAAVAALVGAGGAAFAQENQFDTEKGAILVTVVTEGLDHPWAIAFLPDGDMLVTERPGNLRVVKADGSKSEPISGTPQVDARGQGGLLDVALDPDFGSNRLVYLSFAEAGEGGNSTAVARGRLSEDRTALENVEVIFSQQPKVESTAHFGSRLVFDNEGHLYVTMGERSDRQFRDHAQDLTTHLGTIARINPDGSVPDDNPFVGRSDALPEIYAYGIRNSQAAALHPETGVLWEIEHGPRGGDELNIIRPGANYGWPVVTFGREYYGPRIGEGTSAPGMEDPIYQWTPVIAPSGMIFYGGDAFPKWQGNLFVGGLASTALVRLELDGEKVTHEERLLEDLDFRIRDVAEGPDGAIYVATDEDNGMILRIAPAE